MTFADLVTGDAVFVDANIFIHLFEPHPQLGPFCHQLIQRIDDQDLMGYTSGHVVSEVSHRLMTMEANRALGWSITGIRFIAAAPAVYLVWAARTRQTV